MTQFHLLLQTQCTSCCLITHGRWMSNVYHQVVKGLSWKIGRHLCVYVCYTTGVFSAVEALQARQNQQLGLDKSTCKWCLQLITRQSRRMNVHSPEKSALTKNTNLQTSQPRLDLWVDVWPAIVNCNGPGLHFKLVLCEGRNKCLLIISYSEAKGYMFKIISLILCVHCVKS